MKKISIQRLTTLILMLIVVWNFTIFYEFYSKTKVTIDTLIKENTQTEALHLNHFLTKNFTPEKINLIASQIDNFVLINRIISDIRILNENNKVIYNTSKMYENTIIDKNYCISIKDIMKSNILKVLCYKFKGKYYKKLDAHYYTVYIYLNKQYISDTMNKEALHILYMFLITTVLLILGIFFILKKYVIYPLEGLRRYAYYSEYPPVAFVIKEFESIRYSLEMTFKRLKLEQENLYQLSTKDSLTGLYNRLSLQEKITWFISTSQRTHESFAVIYLDLDNFKNINDSKGHNFGDKVLKKIATTLLHTIRENDIAARIGGDEFIILLPNIENEDKIHEIAQRIKHKLTQPLIIDKNHYTITASMGITLYPKDGNNFHTLLKNADIAMYKSKALGKNNYYFFTNSLNEDVQKKINIERLLQSALENNHFELFYQPKVDIQTNEMVSCEALIRLIDPIEGIIPPDDFIPIAEENGLIISIGEWVLKEACSQIKQWEQTQLSEIKISVNVSGLQLEEKDFFDVIKKYTKDIDISKLDLELTESVLISDFDLKVELLHKIKELGITLSLDDFGTGYSSISYLKRIPYDTLKIDKTFIDNIKENELFLNMIITIANTLNLDIVAEGVETQEQLAYLKDLNCNIYQGYLCSKPLPAHQFEKLFSDCKSGQNNS
ncbi:putative bifunctional diguanylate cyclase/phosphodiesterase [Sulfurimonas sp.]